MSDFDTSELDEFATQFGRFNVAATCRPVMKNAGRIMKDNARAEAKTVGPHARRYYSTIQFEAKDAGMTVNVAPREEGQGLLSAVIEYGQGANAPHPVIIPQLEKEAGPTATWLGKVLEDGLS